MAVVQTFADYDLDFDDLLDTAEVTLPEPVFPATAEVLCINQGGVGSSAIQLTTPSGWTLIAAPSNNSSLVNKWYVFARAAGSGSTTVPLAWTQTSAASCARLGAFWFSLSNVATPLSVTSYTVNAFSGSPFTTGESALVFPQPSGFVTGVYLGHLLRSLAGSTKMLPPAETTSAYADGGASGGLFASHAVGSFTKWSEVPRYDFLSDPSGSATFVLGTTLVFEWAETVVESVTQSPLDRYRSSISADAGSLLATTRAVPFDTSHSIAFSPAAELDQETLYPFHEATSIQSGTPDVLFYPRARQSLSGPVEYDGVTILTLMERAYPRQILTTTSDAGLTAVARAQPIIDYVLQQWAAEFPWFTYKPVTDLRLRDVNVTSDWDEPNNVARTVLRDTAIRVLQSPDSPRSMRAMLEDLLSPFPGTQFFMDADGDLVIRPVYGPDADASPHKTLDDADVVTISIGEPSVDQIINRSTVSFRQFTQADDVSVLEPAFLQVASNYMRDASFSPGPPVTDYLVTPPTDRLDLSTADAGFGGWRTIPLGEGVLMGNGPISFEDSGVLITAAVNTYNSAGVLQEAWTSPSDLTVEVHNTVPLDGSTVLAFTVWRSVGDTTNSYYGRWNARWNTAENALQIQWAGGGLEVNTFSSGTLRAAQMSITINGVARAWAEGASVSATFGIVADGDFIPGPDGSNALQDSVTAFGVLEERFEIRGYGALTPEMLARIAEARVMTNLTPRATRELALTWKGAVGLEFDDRGRLVGFPTDGEGFLIGRRYADDFLANAGGVVVKIEETVPAAPGTIDDCTEYLLNDDGSLWTNDDLTPSIVAECGEELIL